MLIPFAIKIVAASPLVIREKAEKRELCRTQKKTG
jgi:hypothetical protein